MVKKYVALQIDRVDKASERIEALLGRFAKL